MAKEPQTVDELYPPRWFKAWHLEGKPLRVTIAVVSVEEFFVPTSGNRKTSAVVAFHGQTLRLILNKTQCASLAKIFNSGVFKDWLEKDVLLVADRAPNGKPTIRIDPAPKQRQASAPAAVQPQSSAGAASGNGNGQHLGEWEMRMEEVGEHYYRNWKTGTKARVIANYRRKLDLPDAAKLAEDDYEAIVKGIEEANKPKQVEQAAEAV